MKLDTILTPKPIAEELWQGSYKIPWHEAEFSKRMLQVHLSQDSDLASRRLETIEKQAQWLEENAFANKEQTILDLGCGPGLYLKEFTKLGHKCRGIDFSPASVAHGQKLLGDSCPIELGDITKVDYGSPVSCVTLLYGEIDVFSPAQCETILKKARAVLAPFGKLIIEPHRLEAVQKSGQAEDSWYKCESGLFLDEPHVCLIENNWYDEEQTSLQRFFVIQLANGEIAKYHSTTIGRTKDQYVKLLQRAGFGNINFFDDWPQASDHFQLICAELT